MNFMKTWLSLGLLGINIAGAQQSSSFINNAYLEWPLETPVDAESFSNRGIVAFTEFPIPPLPFDTQNTLYYTNSGHMNNPAGFLFQHIDDRGKRTNAKVFRSEVLATIGSEFPPYGFDEIDTNIVFYADNKIEVYADEIYHAGLLSVGSSGLIKLKGVDVDLSPGGGSQTAFVNADAFDSVAFGTNFIPSTGIFDNYWGGLTNGLMDTSGLLNVAGESANVTSPGHLVTNASQIPFPTVVALQGANFSIISNALTETNIVIQAAFVSAGPGIDSQIRFVPSTRTNEISTAWVELTTPLFNPVDNSSEIASIYLEDTLAWDTNLVFQQNLLSGNTLKPSTYNVYRNPQPDWLLGAPGTGELSPDLLYNSTFSNILVTNYYSAYSVFVSPNASQQQYDPFTSVPVQEYMGGVIDISAEEDLDLRNSRMKGTLVNLSTANVQYNEQTKIHAAHANYELSSKGPVLDFEKIGAQSIPTFEGDVNAYSAIWTNLSGIIITNPPADENSEETYTTNVVEYFYHVLMVDAVGMKNQTETSTHDLKLHHDTKVNIGDAKVLQSFEVDSPALTVNGVLALEGKIQKLNARNLIGIREFENNGVISVAEEALFGYDTSSGFDSFVNHGSIFSFSSSYKSDYFENSGDINASSAINIQAGTVKLQGGIISGRRVTVEADHLKMHGSTLPASEKLIVQESFVDSGPGANNQVTVNNGFSILGNSHAGDLLGTSIKSVLPWWAEVQHIWASDDRGKSKDGFENNAAIGHLHLTGVETARARFSSPGQPTALYVDYLEFSGGFADHWETNLTIDEDVTLYFGDSNVPIHELDGALGGRLQWVADYAGPRSGVNITTRQGVMDRVNKARLRSERIDDDGDGVVNAFDSDPFGGVILTNVEIVDIPTDHVRVSWKAAGSTTFRLEYKENIFDDHWLPVTHLGQEVIVSNDSLSVEDLTASDHSSEMSSVRFYRTVLLSEDEAEAAGNSDVQQEP